MGRERGSESYHVSVDTEKAGGCTGHVRVHPENVKDKSRDF